MKNYIKNKLSKSILILAGAAFLASCTDSFLKPDPLSFYEPEATFSTESGLKSVLAMCDRHLRLYWTNYEANNIRVPIGTEYLFSDVAIYGKTDNVGGAYGTWATRLTPTSGIANGDDNQIKYFWDQHYSGIKYANTILSYIDQVGGLSDEIKNEYKGRAYFHRAYRYLALVFQFGNVPLVTKILEAPKRDYKTTKKEAILEMITQDMEKAVEWVPEQVKTQYIGMVNKGACRQLLIKCYLATGQFDKAEQQADILIDQSGYSLMTTTFGTFNEGGEPETWKITDNVIWDLHRPENKLIAANKELIMGMPNNTADSHTDFLTMRIFGPMWSDNSYLKSPDAKAGAVNYARNHKSYDKKLDLVRAFGRGIATVSGAIDFQQHGMWVVNGVEDTQDLRHNHEVGNWVRMEDMKYNNPESEYYGKNFMLYADKDFYVLDEKGNIKLDENGNPIYSTRKGDIVCTNLIRDWFDYPHYKIFLKDETAEANQGANQFNGASTGSNANWYLYRLAETYLLRAEAKFYQGKDATSDVNEVRKRAQCSQFYTSVTIGDIANERARELYLEEWRAMELKRISYCLALSGKVDEWGNTYSKDNWDKQAGTDAEGGSYWYQRLTKYSIYNQNPDGIKSGPNVLVYTLDKRNVYWPIPNDAITANNKAQLAQNYGYDGYDANIPVWDNWQDAVADEDKTE